MPTITYKSENKKRHKQSTKGTDRKTQTHKLTDDVFFFAITASRLCCAFIKL